MSDALVRGWCPGALRPMESGDGLIVRLKITGGIVDVALAERIARWSRCWGNGEIDLSNRANLQLRGIAARHLRDLHAALADQGLLDGDAAAEAVRNVTSSPLAGLDPDAMLDVRPIARDLERRLAGDATLHGLPGKFGFAVDDGGLLGLDAVPADIRFVASGGVDGFGVHLAGGHDRLGPCRADALVDTAVALARVFLRLRGQTRRMRDLVAAHGAEAIAREAGLAFSRAPRPARVAVPSTFLGVHALGSAAFLGVGLPFGRIAADDLSELAAAANGAREIRLTPWRAILVPVPSISAARAVSSGLAPRSFILDPADPRLRIAACPGAPSCVRATTPVREDAASIADAARAGTMIHVSGCEKGCAHPAAAAVTLVGRDGRYDLVRDGVASDAPVLRDLTLEQAMRHIVVDQPRGRAA